MDLLGARPRHVRDVERGCRGVGRGGRRHWALETPHWGSWDIPETELRILPEVAGLDVVDPAVAPATGVTGSPGWGRGRGPRCVRGSIKTARAPAGVRGRLSSGRTRAPRRRRPCRMPPSTSPFRVRRGHLVRPVPVDPRGPPPAATRGRLIFLGATRQDRDPLLAGHRRSGRASASSAPSSACTGPTGRTPRPRTGTSPTGRARSCATPA